MTLTQIFILDFMSLIFEKDSAARISISEYAFAFSGAIAIAKS